MAADPVRRVELRLYRAALRLCPPAFRDENADEMLHDFTAAREEARGAGRRELWRVRLQMAIDLVRTVAVQWSRSGLLLIALAALVVPLVAVEALVRLAVRARFTIPREVDQPELLGLLVLAVTSVFVIATTIAMTLWASRPIRRARRLRR
jgi:hypothetical protein